MQNWPSGDLVMAGMLLAATFCGPKRKEKKSTGDWVKAHIWLNRCLAIWLRQRPPAVFHFSFIFLEGGGCQPTAQTN